MKAAQFFTGKINGYEQNYETPNLIDLLDIDKLGILKGHTDTSKPKCLFFKDERVIARAEAYKVENGDESGRSGIQTRGILYKYDYGIEHEGIQYLFPTAQFIDDLKQTGKRLKMPPMPELKKPLDPPPPLEWEV